MVDLPPSDNELNDYGKFTFLNEMHLLAAHIQRFIQDQKLLEYITLALECIEDERNSMLKLYDIDVDKPDGEDVQALIRRCAELYLDQGTWFKLSNASLRLPEKNVDREKFEMIMWCFHETQQTNKLKVQAEIINLTLARVKMMSFFNEKQKEITLKNPYAEVDDLSKYTIKTSETKDSAQLMNESNLSDDDLKPSQLFLTDDDYLESREKYVWGTFKKFRPIGSVFSIIWYVLFTAFSIYSTTKEGRSFPVASTMSCGFALTMLLFEIASARVCLIACFRPKSTIDCLYPGIELYYIQYVASWIGSVAILIAAVADKWPKHLSVTVMDIQIIVSCIVPFFFYPCFFETHKRLERKFRWARVGFFTSDGWIVVQVIFCLIFTPGICGVQMLIASALRNKTSVVKKASPQFIEEL